MEGELRSQPQPSRGGTWGSNWLPAGLSTATSEVCLLGSKKARMSKACPSVPPHLGWERSRPEEGERGTGVPFPLERQHKA